MKNMKKINLIIASVIALSMIAIIVFGPLKVVSQKQVVSISQIQSVSKSNGFPENVASILSNSCKGCHGDGGKKMAMSMWNFDKWDTYTKEKQSKKANAICKTITKGSMPPKSVKKSYPDLIPNTAQKEIICNWANSLNKK
jgi:hypothetical protein